MLVSRPARPRSALAAAAIGGLLIGTALTLHPVGASADAPAPSDACAEHLLTVDATGTTGDPTAVAITAQTLAADTPGWVDLTWEAGAGHTVATVLATGADGEVTATDGGATGRATSVTSLTFCGSAERSAPGADTETIR